MIAHERHVIQAGDVRSDKTPPVTAALPITAAVRQYSLILAVTSREIVEYRGGIWARIRCPCLCLCWVLGWGLC